MYDNSKQHSAVLPLVLSTVGSVLIGMVVRRLREDRAAARGEVAGRAGRAAGRARPARKNSRGPVL
ncbi:hypothetical protein [uncultured Kocuria sp.]|uniref:hypothetical protein n=1 Tax=uncultured Kocuria sp. TaxID=259305 RepID=UPI0026054870|nr:hypothetical protein [uncultured Kocuria sp.]